MKTSGCFRFSAVVLLIALTLSLVPIAGAENFYESELKSFAQFYVLTDYSSRDQGYSFWYGRPMGDTWDVRVGFDFYGTFTTNQYESNETDQAGDVVFYAYDLDSRDAGFLIACEILNHFQPMDRVRAFIALGPAFAYDLLKTSTTYRNENSSLPEDLHSARREESFAAGLSGSFGVEWFFARRMSLSAEYGGNIMVIFMDDLERREWEEGELTLTEDRTGDGWELNLHRVKLGLAYYF